MFEQGVDGFRGGAVRVGLPGGEGVAGQRPLFIYAGLPAMLADGVVLQRQGDDVLDVN